MLSQMETQDKVCKGQGSQKIEDPGVPREVFSCVLKNKVVAFQLKYQPVF